MFKILLMSNMNDKSDINPPVETNYEKHQNHPAPSKEAVIEEDKNGASKVLKWIIPVLVVLLIIIWLFFKN